MENAEAKRELIKDATGLAYSHIRFSGAFKLLSPAEWEAMSENLGVQVYELLESRMDGFFTKKESAKVG